MIDKSVKKKEVHYFKSITDLCRGLGVSSPLHPLIISVNHADIAPESKVKYLVHDFYMVSYKSNLKGKLKYGQGHYDFDEGGLLFVAPGQALSVIDDDICSGRSLFVHPDFFAGHPLSRLITKFGFFGYNINEALHLSENERNKILHIFENIREEIETVIDDTSQELILSYLEVLLNYSNRYYKRQFITRKAINSPLTERFEMLLNKYYEEGESVQRGIPSVGYFSAKLNVSYGYLSDLLRSMTGMNTQQHIHAKLIEIAKQKLSLSDLTAAEIAFELGFEYPQSFNKLFKNKTGLTPLQFRERHN